MIVTSIGFDGKAACRNIDIEGNVVSKGPVHFGSDHIKFLKVFYPMRDYQKPEIIDNAVDVDEMASFPCHAHMSRLILAIGICQNEQQ
jgi:hypothetical protein